ncbi:hypothetical protein M0805_002002 [Coniferiporia weirii]|nr:hypothetical protein M0805_002002 [Coniferiporia weirii]
MSELSSQFVSRIAGDTSFQRGPDGTWQNPYINLAKHSSARNQAVAKYSLLPGTTIVRDIALSVVLLPEEKGQRCDACLRRARGTLRRCSGCTEYWYCNLDCQGRHWRAVHKHMCKRIARFHASNDFQASPPHRQLDAILLSHLVSEHKEELSRMGLPREDLNEPLATFFSLTPLLTEEPPHVIYTSGKTDSLPSDTLSALYSRFSNNNFIIHSHLSPIGHGIFPLASRLFNHSCMPNAVIVYNFGDEGTCMSVKVLTEIQVNEEITIPYFDPALPFRRRQEICQFSYGFKCVCFNCTFCRSVGSIPHPPTDIAQREEIERSLITYVFPDMCPAWSSKALLYTLPRQLTVVLHEEFLPSLSKTFRDAAHDGHYELALRSGIVLLALYIVLYPRLYPQTGAHCLELAKTAWNASIQGVKTGAFGEANLLASSRQFLSMATDSLSVLGKEGDEDEGPSMEVARLKELLTSA